MKLNPAEISPEDLPAMEAALLKAREFQNAREIDERVTAQVGERIESDALAWLAQIEGAQSGKPYVETHAFFGRDWFVYRGNAEDIARAGLWSARGADGRLNLLATGVFTSFLASLMHVYLMRSAEGTQPLFPNYVDAYRVASSTHPVVVEINGLLFEAILGVNPGVKPKAAPEIDEAPDDTPPLA